MRYLLLVFTVALVACSSHQVNCKYSASKARSAKFFNGVSMKVPAGMCLRESRGPDFSVYQLESEKHVLAKMYIGTAGGYSFDDCQGAKTSTVQGGQVGKSGLLRDEVTGVACGEVGLRPSDSLGYFVHVWWSSITVRDLALIQEFLRTATRGEEVPDDEIAVDIRCADPNPK